MRPVQIYFLILLISMFSSCAVKKESKHLFILSGQSNMQLLKPEESFTPILEERFGKKNIIVTKYALGKQSIRKWYQDWKPPIGGSGKAEPVLYDSLMKKVNPRIQKNKIASVTFIWMQGERDAKMKRGEVYEQSLLGLYKQLCEDLKRDNINFIIGRINDFDMKNKKWPHWTMIRDIQEKIGNSNPRFSWVNTDDLNDGINRKGKKIKNHIHMSASGYIVMGKRFAEEAIQIIESNYAD